MKARSVPVPFTVVCGSGRGNKGEGLERRRGGGSGACRVTYRFRVVGKIGFMGDGVVVWWCGGETSTQGPVPAKT